MRFVTALGGLTFLVYVLIGCAQNRNAGTASEAELATRPATAPATTQADVDQGSPTESVKKRGRGAEAFEQKHQRNLSRIAQGPIDVLFMGDSITEGWGGRGKPVWEKVYAPIRAANFGIGGDRTQHVIWRIENGELDISPPPKVMVLMIGTNNTGGRDTPEEIAQGVQKIMRMSRAKLPQTRILLLGVFPRSRGRGDKIAPINVMISKLDDGKMVRYLDIGDKFLDAGGKLPAEIFPDGLHPNEKGYEIWADAMNGLLGDMLGSPLPRVQPVATTQKSADIGSPTDSVPQVGPQARRFVDRHQRNLKRKDEGPIDVLFLGDSITEGWEWGKRPAIWNLRYAPLNAANFGVGGDRTQNVLWRITDGGELDGLSPKVVVLLIGTNNLGTDPPDAIAAGIEKIVVTIRTKSPTTKVLLLAPFPRTMGGPKIADALTDVKRIISKLDDGQNVRYLDISLKLADANGNPQTGVYEDGLHLTDQGYEIWAAAMQSLLSELLKG
jgi:lysophospholipase L1-like esterase